MKNIAYLFLVVLLITSMMSCSRGAKNTSDNLSPSDADLANKKDNGSEKLIDFPESVKTDLEDRLMKESISLVSLKRNSKGKANNLNMEVQCANDETDLPKVLKIVADNFSSLDEIKVSSSGGANQYTIKAAKLKEILADAKNKELDPSPILWLEINSNKAADKEGSKDKAVQSAGV